MAENKNVEPRDGMPDTTSNGGRAAFKGQLNAEDVPMPKYENLGYAVTNVANGDIFATEIIRIIYIDRNEDGRYRYKGVVKPRPGSGWFWEEELEPAPEDYKPLL